MKRAIIILAILFTFVSCQNEQDTLAKDYESLYWETINKGFAKNGGDPFLELTTEDQIGVWDYKLDLFVRDNHLTADQLIAIQAIKDFNHEVGILNSMELQHELLDHFDLETTTILIGNLPNTSENTASQSCWWCWDVVGVIENCHMEFVNGEPIGYYETILVQRRGIFGIRNGQPIEVLSACGNYGPIE